MRKIKSNTVKQRVLKILTAHGPQTSYEFASKLYLSAHSKKLANQTFYHCRREYQEELLREQKERREKANGIHYTGEATNFLDKAEKGAGTPISIGSGMKRDMVTFSELRMLKELAKEFGGLQSLKDAITALQELSLQELQE